MDERLAELRALYQAKNLDGARRLYEEHPGGADPEWHFIGSLVYWHLGDYANSRWAADHGLSLAPAGEFRAKLLYRLGTTEEALGAYGEAIEHLEECLAHVEAYPSLAAIMRGAVLYNLALAYFNRSGSLESLSQAIHHYQMAAEEFRREQMWDHLRQCLQNLAWALCDIGRPDHAAEALDEAAPLCEAEEAQQKQRVATAYQLLRVGEQERALILLGPLVLHDHGDDVFVLSLCVAALASFGQWGHEPEALPRASQLIHHALAVSVTPGVSAQSFSVAKRIQQRVNQALKQQDRGA